MNTPSIKTLNERLRLTPEQARQIKDLISGKTRPENMPNNCHYSHKIAAILEACNAIGEFSGLEYIADKRDKNNYASCYGLSYLNAGDMYINTLIYDHDTGRYSVKSLGDILEKPESNRFE